MVKRTKPPVVDNTPTLLVELDLCIAKTVKNSDGVSELIVAGRDVYTHCLIVAQVAQHLIERFPNWLREKFFPKGSALIAGCHDLGKVSPSFQKKLYQNLSLPIIQDNIARLLACENISIDEKAWGGHAGVSGITIKLITNRSDLAKIVGQHHGYLASKSLFYKPTDSRFGGEEWLNLRKQLVKKLEQQMEQTFPVELLPIQEKVLSGLTTVADWIGSANHFNQADDCDWLAQIPHCLNEAGFIQPKIIADLSFMDIFAFQANSIQQQFINSVNAPGVYILEAPMGIGKTEAALYAAYKLLANNQAQGIYFALPTQLTSEKIYQRTQQFLDKILVTSVEKSQLMLVHSKSNSRMGEEANPDRSWFNQRKRRILAPFAVGTIDQALMAVLHVKHSFVRSFGLIGKVIILDEVHTYDLYTGTVLDKLVQELQQLGCSIIILSATLTLQRKNQLLGYNNTLKQTSYPLITSFNSYLQQYHEIELAQLDNKKINIKLLDIDEVAVEEALIRAEQGEQVLWIENTVGEAQNLFKTINARAYQLGIEVGLLHSRFTIKDRQAKEDYWVDIFGKAGHTLRHKHGRILIGTQVLEQSLDIDADFLITRIAPSDMLLQRLGRLWRHATTPRQATAQLESWILTPSLVKAIATPSQLGLSAVIYPTYVLCRTIEVWQDLTQVNLPNDIRNLIENTYSERDETDLRLKYKQELIKKSQALANLANLATSDIYPIENDDQVATRYSEVDNVEVLLIRRLLVNQQRNNIQGSLVTLLNGDTIFLPYYASALNKFNYLGEWRELANQLSSSIVRVIESRAPKPISVRQLQWLKNYFYLGAPSSITSLLRIALVAEDDSLLNLDGSNTLNDEYLLHYNQYLGYTAQKIGG